MFHLEICENFTADSEVEMRGHKEHGDLIRIPLFLSWQGSMLFMSVLSKSIILNVKGGGGLTKTGTHAHARAHTHTHTHLNFLNKLVLRKYIRPVLSTI